MGKTSTIGSFLIKEKMTTGVFCDPSDYDDLSDKSKNSVTNLGDCDISIFSHDGELCFEILSNEPASAEDGSRPGIIFSIKENDISEMKKDSLVEMAKNAYLKKNIS
ncbi:MAG: hypothetical protein ACW963_00325 [Candidatus Sifarchaeia archaeon]|jgi:hypothetical protein